MEITQREVCYHFDVTIYILLLVLDPKLLCGILELCLHKIMSYLIKFLSKFHIKEEDDEMFFNRLKKFISNLKCPFCHMNNLFYYMF